MDKTTTLTTVFKAVLDRDDFAKGAADLGKDIDNLKAKQKELELTTGKNTVEYQRVTAQLKLTQAEQRKLTDLQKAAITVEKAQEGSNQKLRSQLTLLTDQYNKLSKEQRENTTAGKELGDSIAGITAELKLNEGAVGDTRRNVGNYTESIVAAGEKMKVTTVFTDENRKANLGLQNQMEASARSAAAIGGAFALLSNIIGDNEKAQEALRVITLGVAAATVISNVAKERGAILDTLAFVKTKALTVAQKAYTFALGTSTGALRVFKFALAATGIGALIFLLYEASKAMGLFGTETESAADEQARLNDEIEEQNRKLQEQSQRSTAQSTADIRQLERRKRIMEAEGATAKELFEIERDILTKRIAIQGQLAFSLVEGTKEQVEALQVYYDLQADLKVLELDFKNQRSQASDENKKEVQDLTDTLTVQRDVVEAIATNWERVAQVLATLNEETYPELKGLSAETLAQNQRLSEDAAKSEAERMEALKSLSNLSADVAADVGKAFSDSIDEAGFQTEVFFKKLVTLSLDVLQRQLLTAIAEIYFNQIASKGFAGIATGAALTAIVVGATEAAKAALTKPVKFERGGEFDPFGIEVGGRLHSQGGTKYYGEDGNVIELEKGERLFVNNRKSSALIGALATINQAMGGRGLSGASSYLADGGFASRSISDSVNSQFQSARLAADIVRNLPEFTVSVTELNRVQAGASNVRVVTTL